MKTRSQIKASRAKNRANDGRFTHSGHCARCGTYMPADQRAFTQYCSQHCWKQHLVLGDVVAKDPGATPRMIRGGGHRAGSMSWEPTFGGRATAHGFARGFVEGYRTVANGTAEHISPSKGEIAVRVSAGDEYTFSRWAVGLPGAVARYVIAMCPKAQGDLMAALWDREFA